jgi:hypothetical protein
LRSGRDRTDAVGSVLATILPAFGLALAASFVRRDYAGAWRSG